jgi:hypothetical protein
MRKQLECGYPLRVLCECRTVMCLFEIVCGISKSIGGIWMRVYCPKCGERYQIDWATQNGFKEWHKITHIVPMNELAKVR